MDTLEQADDTRATGTLERFFRLKAAGTTVRTELLAGLTTFATMAYVLAVVPGLLEAGGVPRGPVTVAVIVVSGVATIAMGLYANRPFGLAPGLGSVALIGLTLAAVEGIPWQTSMAMVFVSGLAFVVLTLLGLREAVVRLMPKEVKLAISAGIGLFICYVGFRSAGLVQASEESNALVVGSLTEPGSVLALIGLAVAAAFLIRRIRGGLFLAIASTTVIGIPMGVTVLPDSVATLPVGIGEVAFELDFVGAMSLSLFPFFFAFFISDFFSTLGTVLAVGAKGKMLDAEGNLPDIQKPFLVDGASTMAGALMAVPVMTTYVESASGVEEGGRTGLTAVTTGVLFLAMLFLTPLALMIPEAATAPVLILVGLTMLMPLAELDTSDTAAILPSFMTIVVMIFTFNIGTGIAAGLVAYVIAKVLAGQVRTIPKGLFVLMIPLVYYFFTIA